MSIHGAKSILIRSIIAGSLLLAGGAALAQQQVNVSVGSVTATLPDGSTVPMWGYICNGVTGTALAVNPTCAALNGAAATTTANTTSATVWSPVIITVPSGQDLVINLTNSLTFGANSVPTSMVIVGQLGGGLGDTTQRTTAPSPDHTNAQVSTWPIKTGATGTAPTQGARVQSFSTEVAAGATTSLTWKAPKAGTYLIESGTHPSIQVPMGLYGILVVTAAPTTDSPTAPTTETAPGTAYPAYTPIVSMPTAPVPVAYAAEVPVLMSEIDAKQNSAVNLAVNTAGFTETAPWSGLPGGCGNPSSSTYGQCYPPTVNYSPLYYLFNGVAFDKTNSSRSLFAAVPAPTTALTGSVLVRLVNAGLRMHVPSIVGAQYTAPGSTNPAASGFALIAEDGNVLPGLPRVQSEVFMAAGKTYDVMVNVPAPGASALPIYDRELSLSANAIGRDGGMLGYISVNGAPAPSSPALASAKANPDSYLVLQGQTLAVSDPAKGVIANDVNVYGVQVSTAPTSGTLTLNANGTFTYVPNATWSADSFVYCGNGATSGAACATVTLAAAPVEAGSGISCTSESFGSNVSTRITVAPPGVLASCRDAAGYPLTVDTTSITATGATVAVDPNGGFTASLAGTPTAATTATFTFKAKNSQGTVAASSVSVTLNFPAPSNLAVTVQDGSGNPVADYRWIIEEDRTFYVDPTKSTNTGGTTPTTVIPTFGTNFHTSYMPLVAAGCTGTLSCESGQTLLGQPAVCDVGNGVCRTTGSQQAPLLPSAVALDPSKRYYISILPGDAANPFIGGNLSAPLNCAAAPIDSSGNLNTACGHGMGGAPIAAGQTAVSVLTQASPYQTAKVTVFVFEDDFPLNGEQDAGGGIDVLSPNEPGLGGFNITLFDDAGGTGDATGQMTYDMFNQPLVNSLAGTKDPATGNDACPISLNPRDPSDLTSTGITGTIVTCPTYESDGRTLSPLAGQAVVANMMPGRYGVVATPGADRIARGEEWLQTNTLDGQKAHDSFLKIGEPAFFQEFGPAGFHVSIGFANPNIINGRHASVCNGTSPNVTGNCSPGNTLTGVVSTERMSRTPDERLYGSGDNTSFGFTQCYVSFGDPDGMDFAFTKCNSDGTFTLTGLPDGDWRVTVFDQWNDMLVDGLSTPVRLGSPTSVCPGAGSTQHSCNLGEIAMNQWQANIYTTTFLDLNGNGVRDGNEPGLTLVATNNRFRDGSYSNFNNTDLDGNAGFNEIFPLFSWYVIETDTTRFKTTGVHVVYDAGGPADGNAQCGKNGFPQCGNSTIAHSLANTYEALPLPAGGAGGPSLRVPGAWYCAGADCADAPTETGTSPTWTRYGGGGNSTGRVDPPWVETEGWQGFSGQNNFIEFGKKPFAVGETGGIHGEVIYASTRPFDDPGLLIHTSWTPDVPGVTINLYQEGTAPDGTTSLKLVDTTKTSSWDDWAQGFHFAADGVTPVPNMNCPGQGTGSGTNADLFFFTLLNQPEWLNYYNSQHGGPAITAMPYSAQFKCYDGMHNWNQVQPAPYDGMYEFPSVTARDPSTGKPTATSCTACVPNPDASDAFRFGTPMLPAGKYVVEVVVPPGYELVKEEDKNILIGDNYIAPATVEFPGLGGAIYILPDQAEVSASTTTSNSQNSTQSLGRSTLPSHEGDTGSVETFWPCVGAMRVVPDYISLFPLSKEVAPFAGATRPLCDRKEVSLDDQTSALAKFWIFSSTHVAAHFTGVITDDFTSEFDPFSPTFGEKFSPPNMPVSLKDWTGAEISRVYADQWGDYNGLTYSTWEVNPPNPTGYAPTMMVTCMNDAGNGQTPDPFFDPAYSQFCYEIPFMPGQTQYMDTPVVPTSAFAGAGYNNPDCSYPDAVPGIRAVDGDKPNGTSGGIGPWVSLAGHTLTISALGDQTVPNYGYSGPSATTSPYNQKTITRHYGFGTQCTAVGSSCSAVSSVTIGGVNAPITAWSDTQITVTVPTGVPACAVTQQTLYHGSAAQCGELIVTAGNGKQSVDTVTVTVGGKAPVHVTPSQSIQAAIDAASPGDLIIVDGNGSPGLSTTPAVHNELVLMWKPVRLQGVAAASSVISASTHPAGKLDPWRRQVDCLFGLALNGQPRSTTNPFDSTGTYACGTGMTAFDAVHPQVDRLPLEGILGWDTTVNGNLAEQLQEPSLMGAYEGAGITVLAKGIKLPTGLSPFDPSAFGVGAESAFPAGTTLLSAADCGPSAGPNPYPSNFYCNPSGIDGLTVTASSQGGGGIFVHGWGHNLQIANNRVYGNTGTLSGGINLGQGEAPEAYLEGDGNPLPPGSCDTSAHPTNTELPFCFNTHVNLHHNSVTLNSSIGDELFSSTPAGAGGVSLFTGADYYTFRYNWVCGNLSSGDGGGVGQIGFVYHNPAVEGPAIQHNTILFNQSTNPTIPTNGGGLLIMGAPPDASTVAGGPECGSITDVDCTPGLGDGIGPGLVVDANLILGNAAESGTGGGLRLQHINGTELTFFPTTPSAWYSVGVTNNIIANNVAGWDGGGVSLLDALNANIINNTIMSNDTTASAGVLFNTLGAPLASASGPTCTTNCGTTSAPQPAGLVAIQNTAQLASALPATITCPTGHFAGTTASNGTCRGFSYPLMFNNIIYQNRAFYIGVGPLGTGTQNQQNVVTLYDAFSTSTPVNQATTGQCPTDGNMAYWDIGVRGDLGPTTHESGVTLTPNYSFLTSTTGYTGLTGLQAVNPTVISQYCNGSRVPPENGGVGYQVPPGISDATVPNPIFSLTPAATVDEGNNWINISWGPLSLTSPASGATLGNYAITSSSPAVNAGTSLAQAGVTPPSTDFFGNLRTAPNDIGAVEPVVAPVRSASVSPSSLSFGTWATGTTSPAQTVTVTNTGNVALAGGTFTIAAPFARANILQGGPGSCGAGLAVGASCTYNVVFSPTTTTGSPFSRTLAVAYTGVAVTGSPVTLTGSAAAMAVTPATLTFSNVPVSTTSAAKTLTVHNSTGGTRTLVIAVAGPFSRPTGAAGGTCGATLGNGLSCTINVVFNAPALIETVTGTVTVTTNGTFTVANSPVGLTGTTVAQVIAASLAPASWSPAQTRNCPGTTPAQILACGLDPAQIFTLTNTGNVPLTGIAQAALSGTNTADYSIVRAASTCGPAGGGQLLGQTTLAPGASCLVSVQFKPLTSEATGVKSATVSVTDAAGSQASALTGTAN